MRILHVIDSLHVGGAERMLVEIANATAAEGHEVMACITRSGKTLAADLNPKIELIALNRQRRIELSAMRRIANYAHQQRIDVFHAHGRTTLSFLAATRTLQLTRIPVVFHDHYGGIETDQSVPHWFGLWGRHHVAQYVGVCNKLGHWAVSAGVPAERIHVIDNALDLTRSVDGGLPNKLTLRHQFGIPKKLPLGVVIGGIRREKGIDVLLDAVAQCHSRGCFKIVLIGGDSDALYA